MNSRSFTQALTQRTAVLLCLALLLALGLPGAAFSSPPNPPKGTTRTPSTSHVDIVSSGPLTTIFLGDEISAQVAHQLDGTVYEFYPPDTTPGDAGVLLVVNNALYAPDFDNHGTTATGSLGTYTPFTPVSQSGVTGSGTQDDPYQVVTVVDAGATGLRITQTDSYVVGQESYRTDVQVANSGGGAQSIILYRAADCFLGGSDLGYGLVDPTFRYVSCTENPNNDPPGRIEQFFPITGSPNDLETFYDDLWAWIGTHQPFDNTCDCTTLEDNSIGLSWELVVPAGGLVNISLITTFSPLGNLPLPTTKVADSPTSSPGATNGYTITLTNPNTVTVDLDSITDDLPAGFTYIPGSTTGLTTADPAINGQTLTWSGNFPVPASGSAWLHFGVTVSSTPGTYYNNATALADGPYTVVPTGDTAPITVTGPTSVAVTRMDGTSRAPAPLWALLLVFSGLAALAGLAAYRRLHRPSV